MVLEDKVVAKDSKDYLGTTHGVRVASSPEVRSSTWVPISYSVHTCVIALHQAVHRDRVLASPGPRDS